MANKTKRAVRCGKCGHVTEVSLFTLNCLRCDHEWTPRLGTRPLLCPRCQSRDWDRPRARPAKAMTLAEARSIVEKVDAAIAAHGLPWVEKNWLKQGTPAHKAQAMKLGRARSIMASAAAADLIKT